MSLLAFAFPAPIAGTAPVLTAGAKADALGTEALAGRERKLAQEILSGISASCEQESTLRQDVAQNSWSFWTLLRRDRS